MGVWICDVNIYREIFDSDRSKPFSSSKRELKVRCVRLCAVQHRGLDTLLSEQDLDTISSSTDGWSGSEIEVFNLLLCAVRSQIIAEVEV